MNTSALGYRFLGSDSGFRRGMWGHHPPDYALPIALQGLCPFQTYGKNGSFMLLQVVISVSSLYLNSTPLCIHIVCLYRHSTISLSVRSSIGGYLNCFPGAIVSMLQWTWTCSTDFISFRSISSSMVREANVGLPQSSVKPEKLGLRETTN